MLEEPELWRVPWLSVCVLLEAVEAEGFAEGGMAPPAFGDMQVADILDGRDDGGADGGQVGGPRCRCGWPRRLRRRHVVVVRLDRSMLADEAG